LNEVQLNDVRKFLQINGRRLHILPNPVFGDLIRSIANEASSEELRYERPILLSVGRLEKQKRLDVLLESFFKFRCNHGSGTLLIVGAGSLEGDLKKWVSENDMSHNVIFLGEVKNPFPIFKEADLYVLTSDFEGLPNSLIQGCFLTRRVVATDCKSGPSSILNGYEGGMLAQTGDVDGLVKAYNVMLGHAKVLPSDEWIDRYSEEGSFNKLLRIFSCVGL
jgi:glycosyltransferase involved in cell wall biosynthesis